MKKLIAAILLTATAAFAQEKTEPEYNTVREYKNKVFAVENREPRSIAAAVKLLGSGFKGSGLSVNDELRTITVRDFPENLAAIEEAIKRLDKPVAKTADIEMKISVLIGSKSPVGGPAVPEELQPVVKQLQSTLTYTHYGLMTTTVQRTKPGAGIEGSGVAEPTLLGMTAVQERPIFYSYKARSIALGSSSEASLSMDNFEFSMRVPLDVGNSIQYQSVGFQTPVTIRQKEKVVIGTTTMRDKVLIVVVTASVNQ
jgi:hypothetical protein